MSKSCLFRQFRTGPKLNRNQFKTGRKLVFLEELMNPGIWNELERDVPKLARNWPVDLGSNNLWFKLNFGSDM